MEQLGVFEGIKNVTPAGGEYWRARDLMLPLGYERWENFQEAIERARAACDASSISSSTQFRETTKLITLARGGTRHVPDFFLSRYACYLVAMNGDPSKPEIAAAQSYFAVQTRRQELTDEAAGEEGETHKRIEVRERVRSSNAKLASAAKRAGVRNFAFFHDAGYQSMYRMGVSQLKSRKGIEPKEDFLDCVGRLELAANEFRITLTEEKLATRGTTGQEGAEGVHREVGAKVRNTIREETGKNPEDLPRAKSLRKFMAEKRNADKKKLASAPKQIK